MLFSRDVYSPLSRPVDHRYSSTRGQEFIWHVYQFIPLKARSQNITQRHVVTKVLWQTLPVSLADLAFLVWDELPAQCTGRGLKTQPHCVPAISRARGLGAGHACSESRQPRGHSLDRDGDFAALLAAAAVPPTSVSNDNVRFPDAVAADQGVETRCIGRM